MTNEERLIEAARGLAKAAQSGDKEAMVYWFGYYHGVKAAIEKEKRSKGDP